jgi:hypothetical protein
VVSMEQELEPGCLVARKLARLRVPKLDLESVAGSSFTRLEVWPKVRESVVASSVVVWSVSVLGSPALELEPRLLVAMLEMG